MPWYADPIWSFVATVAQVLSLLAIAFAIYELASRGWRVSGGVLTVNKWALARHGVSGKPVHIADITNVGGAPVLITALVVVNGAILPDQEMRVKYWLAPGESMTVAVQTADPAMTWFRFQWVSPSDRRFTFGSWQVLEQGTPLHQQWRESYERTRGRPWFMAPFKGFWAHKVGPGDDARTAVRITRNITRSEVRAARVFGEAIENSAPWIYGGSSADPVEEPLRDFGT